MSLNIRETRVLDIGDRTYTITQLKATLAYRYLTKIKEHTLSGTELSAEDVKELIVESTSMGRDKFETEFCGRMSNMFKLIEEIIEFNYSDVFQQSASEEKVQE